MDKYQIIYEKLLSEVDNGSLTVEEAECINTLAYSKYILEAEEVDEASKEISDACAEKGRKILKKNFNKKGIKEGIKTIKDYYIQGNKDILSNGSEKINKIADSQEKLSPEERKKREIRAGYKSLTKKSKFPELPEKRKILKPKFE